MNSPFQVPERTRFPEGDNFFQGDSFMLVLPDGSKALHVWCGRDLGWLNARARSRAFEVQRP